MKHDLSKQPKWVRDQIIDLRLQILAEDKRRLFKTPSSWLTNNSGIVLEHIVEIWESPEGKVLILYDNGIQKEWAKAPGLLVAWQSYRRRMEND
jgi:hypothetical protein